MCKSKTHDNSTEDGGKELEVYTIVYTPYIKWYNVTYHVSRSLYCQSARNYLIMALWCLIQH